LLVEVQSTLDLIRCKSRPDGAAFLRDQSADILVETWLAAPPAFTKTLADQSFAEVFNMPEEKFVEKPELNAVTSC
jgi:hypothetical protein